MGLINDLSGRRVYLDSNIFIYFLEEENRFSDLADQIFVAIDRGQLQAVTSQLTIAELLVKPFAGGDQIAADRCRQFVRTRAGLLVRPIDEDILVESARLRAAKNLRLPDAIHVATALQGNCEVVLSNDRGLRKVGPVRTLYLADYLGI